MSRLLFAAARGARIEKLIEPGEWVEAASVPTDSYNSKYYHRRIHPDDLHLQYGPISTVLREIADSEHYQRGDIVYDTLAGVAPYVIEPNWSNASWNDLLHRSLFLLILAEALADEGL